MNWIVEPENSGTDSCLVVICWSNICWNKSYPCNTRCFDSCLVTLDL